MIAYLFYDYFFAAKEWYWDTRARGGGRGGEAISMVKL